MVNLANNHRFFCVLQHRATTQLTKLQANSWKALQRFGGLGYVGQEELPESKIFILQLHLTRRSKNDQTLSFALCFRFDRTTFQPCMAL
eukprot:m.36830 g.36830  ORF g.36830 m.36830 type:complete len:89 (+) comp10036_c0_seq4:423-689(+)